MTDASKQRGPPEDNPGKGRGPPDEFPGKGRGREEVPGNAPFEEVKDKLSNILDNKKSEGRLGIRVVNEDGIEKDRVEHVRVNGHGSLEVRPFEEKTSSDLSADSGNNVKWGMKRMDKLFDNGGEQ